MMRELHLCAGIGCGIIGGMLLGHTCVCAVEIEPYRRKVLLQRQLDGTLPRFPIWDDLRTFDGTPWRGIVDAICCGWPCDDFSTAGKMLGITGPKSGLWREVARTIGEVRPHIVFLENTPAIIVLGLFRVLGDLANMGYDARWGIIGGAEAGMDTDGKRFWLFAEAASQRRSEFLHSKHAKHKTKGGEPANNAYSPSLVERIRKHESRCGEPAILGELDGLAHRVERLEAIGHGQIPSVVKLAWETLST